MGGCCSAPPPHDVHAPEPGIKQERRCHDVCFLILFIVFWVGMFYVASQGVSDGDPNRLVYGTDYEGNICGSNNDRLRQDFPQYARDLTDKKYLYLLPGNTLNNITSNFVGICVESCPTTTYWDPTSVDQLLCPYNITPSLNETGIDGPCWGTYSTESILNRCVPFFSPNTTSEILEDIVSEFNANLIENYTLRLVGDILRAWKYIAGSVGFAILLSFVWILLLRHFAGVIVWATAIGVVVGLTALTYLTYETAANLKSTYDNIPVYARLISQQDSYEIMNGVFYVLAVIDGIIVLILLCMFHRIQIAVGVVEEACRVVLRVPEMMFIPIVTALCMIPLAVYFIIIGAYLSSAGTATYYTSGEFAGYDNNDTLNYLLLYHLFGAYWTLNFLQAICECTIAGVVACWFWVHDKKHVSHSPVLKSFWRIIRYHLGSLLFGSLILAIVQFIRFLLHSFEKSIKGKETMLTKFALKCADCILKCFERFIKFLDKNAYIMIAIYGYSFCEGARRGFSLITSNILRVTALNFVSSFLIFLGKLFVTVVTALIAFLILRHEFSDDVDYILPVIIIAIVAYAVSVAFFGVFDMAVDTILLCFCEDEARNDGSDERPYFSSDSLRSHMDRKHFCLFCC